MSLVFCTIYCHLVGDHKKEIVCEVTATQLKLTFGVCLRQEHSGKSAGQGLDIISTHLYITGQRLKVNGY